MSKKFKLDREIGFQNTFYTKYINVIIDSIGPSIILRSINTYIKLGKIPSICFHDIEWKRNSDRHHSRAISYKLEKTDRQQSQLVCIKAYAKFRQVLCMYSVNIEQKRNKDFN